MPCAQGLAGRRLRLAFTSGKLKIGCQSRVAGDIKRVHRDSHGRYGSPRIDAELRTRGHGEAAEDRTTDALPWHSGDHGQARRCRTTDSGHGFPIAPNLLRRNFSAAARNQIWLTDITYMRPARDGCIWRLSSTFTAPHRGLGNSDHLRAELPLAALRMAIKEQRPGAGLIHHSDRGVQYASTEYRRSCRPRASGPR